MGLHISYRDPEVEAAGHPYSLTLKNQSRMPWIFYVYQKMPQPSNNFFSLAWLASPLMIPVGDQITFEWEVVYNFVWGETGNISPGATFNASGVIDADPAGANATTFSASPEPNLSGAVKAPPVGSLIISDAGSLPLYVYSVGIGMSGAGIHVVQAGPNLTYQFRPTLNYWIAAGTDEKVGTVLSIQTITHTAEVKFSEGVFSKTMTFNEALQWV